MISVEELIYFPKRHLSMVFNGISKQNSSNIYKRHYNVIVKEIVKCLVQSLSKGSIKVIMHINMWNIFTCLWTFQYTKHYNFNYACKYIKVIATRSYSHGWIPDLLFMEIYSVVGRILYFGFIVCILRRTFSRLRFCYTVHI